MSQSVPPGWYPDVDNPQAERWWDGGSWADQRRPRAAVAVADRPSTQAPAASQVDGGRLASTGMTLGYVGLWFCIMATLFSVLGAGFTPLAWMLIIGFGLFTPVATVLGIVVIILASRALGATAGDDRQRARNALIIGIVCTATGLIALVLCVPLGLLFHFLGGMVQQPR